MAEIEIYVRNLRALNEVRWKLGEVNVLVGANGVGKSTVLLVLKFFRAAFDRGFSFALKSVFGGNYNLLNRSASVEEPIVLALTSGTLRWQFTWRPRGSGSQTEIEEELVDSTSVHDEMLLHWDGTPGYGMFRGEHIGFVYPESTFLRFLADGREDPALRTMAHLCSRLTIFHDPALSSLRLQGSSAAMDKHLASDGGNVFTILRLWNERREFRERRNFVLESLKGMFPRLVADFDFETAGNTVVMRFYHPMEELPVPVSDEANGVLSALVSLTAIAGVEDGGLVAIDEPENALHPRAIRQLVAAARTWSRRKKATVIFTTHSPVLLNEFEGQPQSVAVMDREEAHLLQPLDDVLNPGWISEFTLGEAFMDYEFGA